MPIPHTLARMTRLRYFAAVATVATLVGLTHSSAHAQGSAGLTFTDVTQRSGVRFTHTSGAFGQKYLPETMGSGVIVFDYNTDGYQDVFFVNAKGWPGKANAHALPAFYKNNGNGTFTDITKEAGLAVPMYGMGGTAGDFDNDGQIDLFVTAIEGNRLFRNTGKGSFVDVTKQAGVGQSDFSTSAAWVDYDKDGRLDLFVVNYVQWSLETDIRCSLDGKAKSYCTPEAYKGISPRLFRNRGNGSFEDVTRAAGVHDPESKALGIALIDFDQDGWLDLFVANDTQPNRLYRNTGKGTFTDEAVPAGVAFNEVGAARAGMGTDAAESSR